MTLQVEMNLDLFLGETRVKPYSSVGLIVALLGVREGKFKSKEDFIMHCNRGRPYPDR